MEKIEVYSEKLGKMVNITDVISEEELSVIMEDTNSSLVGWCHGGWNNDNGGGNW